MSGITKATVWGGWPSRRVRTQLTQFPAKELVFAVAGFFSPIFSALLCSVQTWHKLQFELMFWVAPALGMNRSFVHSCSCTSLHQRLFYSRNTLLALNHLITTLVYHSISDNGVLKSKCLGVRKRWCVVISDFRAMEDNANDCSSSMKKISRLQ